MAHRFYDQRRWRHLSTRKLHANPLCEYCPPGVLTPATQVDHVIAIEAGGDPWNWDNLKSACDRCHAAKSAQVDLHGADHVTIKIKGVDAKTGLPLDKRHWWNQK
jgi:5-methylcytosine-specific restriction protein A